MGIIVREIQMKRDTAANYAVNNPTLLLGQIAFELQDIGGILTPIKFKVGDSQTPYNSLGYFSTGAISDITTKAVQTGTTVDYIVGGNPAQVQTRDLTGESGDITITAIANLPLNHSIILQVDSTGVAHQLLFSLAGSQIQNVRGSYQGNAINFIVIICIDDSVPGSEEYLIAYTRQGSEAFGVDPGDWPEIGTTLGNSQIVMTDSSGMLVTTAANGAFNLGIASSGQAQDTTNATTLLTPQRGFNLLDTKKGYTVINPTSGAIAFTYGLASASNGYMLQSTLDANTTLTITGMSDGDKMEARIIQDGTGSRTLTIAGTVRVSGNGSGTITLSSGANQIDRLIIHRVGSAFEVDVINDYS